MVRNIFRFDAFYVETRKPTPEQFSYTEPRVAFISNGARVNRFVLTGTIDDMADFIKENFNLGEKIFNHRISAGWYLVSNLKKTKVVLYKSTLLKGEGFSNDE